MPRPEESSEDEEEIGIPLTSLPEIFKRVMFFDIETYLRMLGTLNLILCFAVGPPSSLSRPVRLV